MAKSAIRNLDLGLGLEQMIRLEIVCIITAYRKWNHDLPPDDQQMLRQLGVDGLVETKGECLANKCAF